jgi:type VI protein secretion system component Hcp
MVLRRPKSKGEAMSDEIKNVENEIAKAESSPTLSEQELEQVVGGTKTTDQASPKLFQLCCSGQHYKTVTLE